MVPSGGAKESREQNVDVVVREDGDLHGGHLHIAGTVQERQCCFSIAAGFGCDQEKDQKTVQDLAEMVVR